MKHYLPTREECKDIVQKTDAFFISETEVEGQKVEMYNYRLASISDFVNYKAFELRGLCFVEQPDGTWKRNILLNKFFNYAQTEGWNPKDLDNKEIIKVQNKEDGSIISPVQFLNGKIRMKSKMSFISEQAEMAQDLYNKNNNLRELIEYCFNNNYTPVFELVSPFNQIVLEYKNTELRLLQIRYTLSGEYHSSPESVALEYNVPYAESYNLDVLETIAKKYSKQELVDKIQDSKFQTLDDMIAFLKENK